MLMPKKMTMGFWDGISNGVCGDDCFDNILDFPAESLEGDSYLGGDWDDKFQCLGPIPSEALWGLPPLPLDMLHNSSLSDPTSQLQQQPDFVIPVRSRSKRSRPSTYNPWLVMSPITFTSSKKISNTRKGKERRKKKLSHVSENSFERPSTSKKCTHCEITKTPQWREGPMGPKTLCNACGVRYRSGRLFPEYRPAASPTFVPSLHSNSHKKVTEMRSKSI